jgi:hypothetical protein
MSKKGFEMRNLWGVRRRGFADWRRREGRGWDVAALVTMERSIIVIKGATRMLALAAEVASAETRRPRLVVFHWVEGVGLVVGSEAGLGVVGGRRTWGGLGTGMEGRQSWCDWERGWVIGLSLPAPLLSCSSSYMTATLN